ncbi:hypothetical protein AFA_13105 [Alcaligenes faecalis]|uniref:Toxin CptA n=2 Tax=Alcaligenes TaxID=507 RepID=A0AB33CXK4_ALCFA|nr:hypothetical protein AFA_13105 [Alcaligenes faecalis]AYN21496.1 hypothetical protein D3M96_13740 [Alcaligenes aquatilis]HBQ89318.1 hypothetical protein [Alcaligenes faecalis]
MRRLGVVVYVLLASGLAWAMYSWQWPWAVCLFVGALWANFLYARSRRVWGGRATLAHRAGLYFLQYEGTAKASVQIEQIWRCAWFMTLRLRFDCAGRACRTITVWRRTQPSQAWWALCLCANRLSHQVRAQNKDS